MMECAGMKTIVLICCLLVPAGAALNDRPIIGVLSQELTDMISDNYGDKYVTYIAASYIKHLESAGSRVVPVWTNQSSEYYQYIVNSVNGLLIPGGAAPFNETDGYVDAAWELYKYAKEKNDAGVYFPIWGTCLGFELLAVLSADLYDLRSICDIQNVAMPLIFKSDFRDGRMYKQASEDLVQIMRNENVTINFHHWCITEEDLANGNVSDDWHVLSYNKYNGTEFVSSFEHRKYPFYGVQFHPEKNTFEWKKTYNIPHTTNAVLVEQYYGSFVVNEARKNNNKFADIDQETDSLIYNYNATYTTDDTPFEQIYFFRTEDQVFKYATTTTITTTTAITTTASTTTSITANSTSATSTTTAAHSAKTEQTTATTRRNENSGSIKSPVTYFTIFLFSVLAITLSY